MWGDSAYSGQTETLKMVSPDAKDFTNKKGAKHRQLTEAERNTNRTKSKVRSKVEHVFHVMKCQFGFSKVRYKGLDKNANHMFTHCALINLVMSKNRLLPT